MFSHYQWLLILVIIACIGYLAVYGSSSTSIKEGLQSGGGGTCDIDKGLAELSDEMGCGGTAFCSLDALSPKCQAALTKAELEGEDLPPDCDADDLSNLAWCSSIRRATLADPTGVAFGWTGSPGGKYGCWDMLKWDPTASGANKKTKSMYPGYFEVVRRPPIGECGGKWCQQGVWAPPSGFLPGKCVTPVYKKIPNCKTQTGATCSVCDPGYEYPDGGKACLPTIRNCKTYDKWGNCSVCEPGFESYDTDADVCVPKKKCSAGQIWQQVDDGAGAAGAAVSVSLKECDKTDPAQLGWEYDSADKLFKKYGKCLQRSANPGCNPEAGACNNAVLWPCNASSPAQSVAMAPSGVKDSNQWVTISEAEEKLCLQTGVANWSTWDQILAARKAKADGVATDGVVAPVQFATCATGGGGVMGTCGDDGGYTCQLFGGVEPGGGTVEDLAPGVGGGGMVHRPDVWQGVGNDGKFPEPIKLCLSADTSIGKCVSNCPAGQTWQPSTDAGAYVVAEQCDSSSPAQGGWDWVGQTATGAPITAGGGDGPGVKGVIKKDGGCLQWDSGGNILSALIRPCDGSDAQVMATTYFNGPATAPWDTIKDSKGRCLQAFAHDVRPPAAGARQGSTLGAVQFVACGSTPTFSPNTETQMGQLFGTGSSTTAIGAGPGMITSSESLCLSAQVGGKCAANKIINCQTQSGATCSTCNPNFHTPDGGKTCVANTCSCPNGIASNPCADPINAPCTSCNPGFQPPKLCNACAPGYRNNTGILRSCMQDIPNCKTYATNGTCSVCEPDFNTPDGGKTCVANTCSCPNGIVSNPCADPINTPCKSCNAGFSTPDGGKTCVANTCTCSNGTPATGAACTTNNAAKCAKCATGFHAVGDSCVANPQCSSYTCPSGRQYKPNYKQIGCQTATCQDSECCDPIPQPTCTSFTCPKNSTLNKNPSSITCAGKSCIDTDCCTPNPKPTCFGDNMKCPTNFYLKSNGQQIQCANYTCTTDDCCSANPTCSTIQCGPQFHPKPPSTICASSTCGSTECCNPNPVCLTYTCPAGMKQKTNASSITCTGATCAAPECCSVIPPPPPPPPPGVPPPPPPPSSNITDDPTNIYFPNSNFITFNNEGFEGASSLDPNENSYSAPYSNYNGWTTPYSTALARTTNMFSDTKLPPPVGIASFNNRSFNQA